MNCIPIFFCIILLISFCVDECCKEDCCCKKEGGIGGRDCDCNFCICNEGRGDPAVGFVVLLFLIISAFALIYFLFYFFSKGIGKDDSRKCSLVAAFLFELIIAIYSGILYFYESGEKYNENGYAYIFGISLGLSVINLLAIIIPNIYDCLNSQNNKRKSIINQPIVIKNNEYEKKNNPVENDFDSIPITPQTQPIISPSENIYYNQPIDSIIKPDNGFNEQIQRTESNYDNAPLPLDLPTENEV